MDARLGDIFRHWYGKYRETHGVGPHQHKAALSIMACGTAVMGGHVEYCENGDYERLQYYSCRHRSCPRCNSALRAKWLEGVESRLLNCAHFHAVFALPHELIGL